MGWAERVKREEAGHAPSPHRVLPCIASLDHTVTVPIMHLFDTLAREMPDAFLPPKTVCGHRSIGGARNRLVARFLETDATVLWFIDADVIPSDNTSLLFPFLADDTLDIWGGVYPLMARGSGKDDPLEITWTMYDEADGHFTAAEPDEAQESQEVGGLGTGCMLIRRRVLEDERMRLDRKSVV